MDMGRVAERGRVCVDLPPSLVERLEAEVERGRYASLEDAILAGARLLVALGPRARELLDEAEGQDGLVREGPRGDDGDWYRA
jgi:Arc/MetJ-type ribon-helix-helix transcriptional regulator